MKTSATWAVAAALVAALIGSGSCIAGENSASSILGGLAAATVSTSELDQQHARGVKITNIDSTYTVDSGALSNGALRGNSVVGNSATGTITTTGSINDNNGFTTVFQNSGNNALFQQTTAVYITLAR
jgi:hypothetical protein